MVHKEAHGYVTGEQLFNGMKNAGVPPSIASQVTSHELDHDAAYQRAEGVDSKGVSGKRSFGYYYDSNGYSFNLTAYFEPNDWSELSYQDVEDIALRPPDPSGPDLRTAGRARANRIRQEDKERIDRIYLRNEIEKRMDDLVKNGKELTYEELLLIYGKLIERNEEFVESTLEKAKENALLRREEEKKIGVEITPIVGTILAEEDLELLNGGKKDENSAQFGEKENGGDKSGEDTINLEISEEEDDGIKEKEGLNSACLIYMAKKKGILV